MQHSETFETGDGDGSQVMCWFDDLFGVELVQVALSVPTIHKRTVPELDDQLRGHAYEWIKTISPDNRPSKVLNTRLYRGALNDERVHVYLLEKKED